MNKYQNDHIESLVRYIERIERQKECYKQRIDKAIEYIKENDLYVYIPDNDLNMDYEELVNDKLLEILGDKENE